MVKLKIRVTPNDHRFALLCHCRTVGIMNREGRGAIAPSHIFADMLALFQSKGQIMPTTFSTPPSPLRIFGPSYGPVSLRRRCGEPTRCNSSQHKSISLVLIQTLFQYESLKFDCKRRSFRDQESFTSYVYRKRLVGGQEMQTFIRQKM